METPNKIYLCEGLEEITWCEDRIDPDDVEYIKTSLIKKSEPMAEVTCCAELSALSVELKKGASEFIDLAATRGKQNEQAYSIIAGVLGGLSNAIRDANKTNTYSQAQQPIETK